MAIVPAVPVSLAYGKPQYRSRTDQHATGDVDTKAGVEGRGISSGEMICFWSFFFTSEAITAPNSERV